ncbi:MAG: hypothetical protein KGH60_02695 [Candidatus Micrarchaeota archaeon]|nr:hypothetical protein [Candidatus Micrarchaeota archaeon]
MDNMLRLAKSDGKISAFKTRLDDAQWAELAGDIKTAANGYRTLAYFVKVNHIETDIEQLNISFDRLVGKAMNLGIAAGKDMINNATNPVQFYEGAHLLENSADVGLDFGADPKIINECGETAVNTYITKEHPFHGVRAAIRLMLRQDIIDKARSKAGQWAEEKYDHFMLVGYRLAEAQMYQHAFYEFMETLNTAKEYLTREKEIKAAEHACEALRMRINKMLQMDSGYWAAQIALQAIARAELAIEYELGKDMAKRSLMLAYDNLRQKIQNCLDIGNIEGANGALRYYTGFCKKYNFKKDTWGFYYQLSQLKSSAKMPIHIRLDNDREDDVILNSL